MSIVNPGKLTEQSNLQGFENVHSSTGDYQVTVDKIGRISIGLFLSEFSRIFRICLCVIT